MFNGGGAKCETVIAAGCQMEGKLTCKGPSRIGGEVEGDLFADDLLILESTSRVNGNVFGQSVEVGGIVNGAVRASARVTLRAGAKIDGEIESPAIVIDEGAKFNGMTKMSKPSEPVPKLAVIKPTAEKSPPSTSSVSPSPAVKSPSSPLAIE